MNTKQLRQKILDLAIRGKLVPQDPNDEPASVLLERVRAEKERLIKEGKIKRDKKDSAIFCGDDKLHYGQFDIPASWEWVELGTVCELSNGISKRKSNDGTSTIVLRLADLDDEIINLASPRMILLSDREIAQYKLDKGDLLFVRVNGSKPNVGKSYVFENDGTVAYCDHLMRGRVSASSVNSNYLRLALRSTFSRMYINSLTVTTAGQNTISQGSLCSIIFPLPPLAEQQRIVASIESAFTLIDEIERNKNDLQTAVITAKKKILSLAICGKLVPQDPGDEPASVLLERIRTEREALIRAGKIKRGKGDSVVKKTVDNSYHTGLPYSWALCQLRDVGQIVGGGTPSTNEPVYWENGTISWITPADLSGFTGKYIATGNRNITAKGLSGSSAQLMPAGSVLFSSRAPIGYIVIATNEVCTNQGFKSVVPFVIEMNEYIYYFLMAQLEEIRTRASGTTFKEISGTEMGNTIFILPPLAEQQRIVAAIEAAFEQLDRIVEAYK